MISFPNAKINIGLQIVSRYPDGYHALNTLFYPVGLSDILEIVKGDVFEFSTSGLEIGGKTEDNLVIKAYQLLQKKYSIPSVKIHLHKIIPMGAGLGGGSSDAAFALKMLNQLFALKIPDTELEKLASSLGADCAFFIQNRPVFASGKGDEFQPVNLDLQNYRIVIIYPHIRINTAWAYSQIKPHKNAYNLQQEILSPIRYWQKRIRNDFEPVMAKKYCPIRQSLNLLKENGAIYSAMSGSGSAVFGIFESTPDFGDHRLPVDIFFPANVVDRG
jgi:4-diphosphocytidyl-2-C-methyl-D-erythritol kinase